MKTINYISAEIPSYALCYLANGDSSGLDDGEQETVDAWFDICRDNLAASHPGATIDLVTRENYHPSFVPFPAFGLACDCVPGAVVAMVDNGDPAPAMALPWQPDFSPAIHAGEITAQDYLGFVETEEGELHVISISHPSGNYLVAGGACNAGLLPSFARLWDDSWESKDEALQELIADIEDYETGGSPSGELLTWHGSLVI